MAKREVRARPRPRRLKVSELRWRCPSSWVPAANSRGTGQDPLPGLIGQERALDALEMGLAVTAPGYNVFVSGLSTTERTETVRLLLEQMKLSCGELRDHVFVHNFRDPIRPRHLALPAGNGGRLVEAMAQWKRALAQEIPRLLESDEHLERRNKLFRRYTLAEEQLFRRLARRAQAAGLALVQVEEEEGSHQDIYLLVDGEPVSPDGVKELDAEKMPPKATVRRLMLAREAMLNQLRKAQAKARALGLRLLSESQSLDENRVRQVVEDLTMATAEEVGADLEMADYLGECARFALNHLHLFRRGHVSSDDDDDDDARRRPGTEVFEINLVRSAGDDACPTVTELHPNYSNLFGTVERRMLSGGPGQFHMAVRPGSLLAADGGFLVVNARDVFKEAEVWRALKRTLQHQRLEVHALEAISPLGVTGVRPEPIPITLKVVMIGDNSLFEHLHDSDYEFPQIFKVKAEFDESLPLNRQYVGRFVRVVRNLGKREKLLPFSNSGLQALVERSVRDAGTRNRLSARISDIADYAREASYFARRAGKRRIDRSAVDAARKNFRRQHSIEYEWHNRAIMEGIYAIDTHGERVGSVNALTVVGLGPLEFGRVARVSASVSAGDDSYLNIEREVELSGPIHTKGVLLLESFMRNRFGQKRTLPIKAALSFDQNYGPIDGDSASSTEVYALLSALSGLPVRQDVAVTGAVDMRGNVLAVGGLNEKIEGFFDLCRQRGLTGEQGVIIPESNVQDLMLDEEVVAAVRSGKFHIYSAKTVDQGIALLTGVAAGSRRANGEFPPDSIMGRTEAALDAYEKELSKDDQKPAGRKKPARRKAGALVSRPERRPGTPRARRR